MELYLLAKRSLFKFKCSRLRLANMADGDAPKEFPDVSKKLAAPKQLSAYEKERQAAQAKEKRAEAENAAALKAFQESFADGDSDDDDRGSIPGSRGPSLSHGATTGRYGMPSGPRSGPGSLGPIPGPPPSIKRKRALEEMREAQRAREEEMREFDDRWNDSKDIPQPQSHHTSSLGPENDYDAPRPAIQLSSLPPATSTEDIKALLKDYLKVFSVRFTPRAATGAGVRHSLSATATLSADVTNEQITTAVSALKNKYLGCGFYLSLSRHTAYADYLPPTAATPLAPSNEPFGAKQAQNTNGRSSMRNAPPPGDHRGFAPPDSYDSPRRAGYDSPPSGVSVTVQPPLTIAEVKGIHVLVDALLLQPDPQRALQMEAMLMSLPEVQKDERFSFLYDSRSPAGVYYRFLLWSPEDPDEAVRERKRRARGVERIHEDIDVNWIPPYGDVPFPDLHSLEQAVTDMDYVSSDEDSDDESGQRQFNSGREGQGPGEAGEKQYLSPLKRARLVHLLSRLPTSNARLRKGDVARVTNFAITHAGSGAQEIVDLLLLNVEKPFSASLAAKYESSDREDDDADAYEPAEELSNLNSMAALAQKDSKRDEDPSNAKLIGLYLISDILSASSTAGARNAWKYRQLFEAGLIHQKTFERLGKLGTELSWGRMKAEQWKRKIEAVFGIWENWSVFSSDFLHQMKHDFFGQAANDEDKVESGAEANNDSDKGPEEKSQPIKIKQLESPTDVVHFQRIRTTLIEKDTTGRVEGTSQTWGLDGASDHPVDSTSAEQVNNRSDMNRVGSTSSQAAAADVSIEGLDGTSDARPPASESVTTANGKTSGSRRRMRAEDMFADSDNE